MSVTISTDKALLDIDLIHRFLSEEAYWSLGVPRDVVERSIANSICVAAYSDTDVQVAFMRVVTDRATFAWLCDVFVLPEHRGQGISKRMMEAVMALPDISGLRLFILATRDAHGLYEQYGFERVTEPGRFMWIRKPYR